MTSEMLGNLTKRVAVVPIRDGHWPDMQLEHLIERRRNWLPLPSGDLLDGVAVAETFTEVPLGRRVDASVQHQRPWPFSLNEFAQTLARVPAIATELGRTQSVERNAGAGARPRNAG